MFVVARVTSDRSIPLHMRGLCIGFSYFAATLSTNRRIGSSVNPVMSLAYAICNSDFSHIAIYLTAPFIGALIGVFFHNVVASEINHNNLKSSVTYDNEAYAASKKDRSSINGSMAEKDMSSRLVEEDESEEMIRED